MGVTGLFILGLAIANRALATDDGRDSQERWSWVEPLPWSSTSCLLRVTLSCEKEHLEPRYGDLSSFPHPDGYAQVTVGEHLMLRKIADEPDRKAWKEVMEFDCVEPWSMMVFTVYNPSMHSLASCETRWKTNDEGGMEGVCQGQGGVEFRYQVEHEMKPETGIVAHGEPALRALQSVSDTPTPSPSPIDPTTPGPLPASPEAAQTSPAPVPSLSPVPAVTGAPSPNPVAPIPLTIPSPAPTLAQSPTVSPVNPSQVPPTGQPVTGPTPTPMTPETPNPTPILTEKVTGAPSKAPTPEPSLVPVLSPTGRPVAATPIPVTDAPLATSAPTPKATLSPTGTPASPVAQPSTTPVASTTENPVASESPQTPTTAPSPAPTIPTISPSDVSTGSNSTRTPSATSSSAESPTAFEMPSMMPTPTEIPTTVPSTTELPTPEPTMTQTPSPSDEPVAETPAPAAETQPTPEPADSADPTPAPVGSTSSPIGPCDSDCDGIPLDDNLGAYYDEDCEGVETGGCNLDVDGDNFKNCRKCVIDMETYNGSGDYGECVCCVTASCSSTSSDEDLDLMDLETDPWMLVMEFSQDSCEASGILVEDNDNSILDIARFEGADGGCDSGDFDSSTFYGDLCEDDGLSYNVSIEVSSFVYEWNNPCAESESSRRRRLEGESLSFDSMEVLCNNEEKFVALFDITDGENGVIYAQSSAQGYSALSNSQDLVSDDFCDDDANGVMETLMAADLDALLNREETSESDDGSDMVELIIIIAVVAGLVVLLGCLCCVLCRRKGKGARADQMRRNLGYTPDMEAKGEGNFGPTSTHVAITRGGGPKPTPEMLATKTYLGTYPVHNRAPSEAPSSIIENNITNNYRPRQAQQAWEERRVRKELTKPPTHQNLVTGATRGSPSEELKTENVTQSARSSDAPRSEQLSEASLSKLEQERSSSKVIQPEGQPPFQYGYDEAAMVPEEEEDDDARSAMTGMSGPSKYAPSGYAPSSHHGVTHDQLSHYEPSVYEADSTYDASIYGRESEFDDGSTYYSHDARSSHRGGGYAVRSRPGYHPTSTRGSVADTAAGSVLGSVMEMDDGDDTGRSAYAPSESYVSSYISSEDDEGRVGRVLGRNVPANGDSEPSPASGRTSRHSAHRSGRESVNGGRGFTPSTTRTMSSRHHSGRSGFDHESRGYDDDETYDGGHGSMEDVQYFDDDRHSQVPSSQGVPLTGGDETSSRPGW